MSEITSQTKGVSRKRLTGPRKEKIISERQMRSATTLRGPARLRDLGRPSRKKSFVFKDPHHLVW